MKKKKEKEIPLQWLNSFYYKGYIDKKYTDELAIVYRNEETKEKEIKIIREPEFEFRLAKDNILIEQEHLNYIPLEDTEIVQLKYKDLFLQIAREIDSYNEDENKTEEKLYFNNIKQRKNYENNNFHHFNRIFGTDINIEDYYKGKWLRQYNPSNKTITKSFTDIEVDSIEIDGFPNEEEALCPVNAITFLYSPKKLVVTLLLRNPNNPLIEELEEEKKEFIKELKKELGEEYTYKLLFYDDEYTLLADYFTLNNKYKPDFDLIWNMPFDIQTIINRMARLKPSEDHLQHICPEEFPEHMKKAVFHKDKKHQKAEDKNDWFECTSYTMWIDALALYASIRKGMGVKDSYALNDIAKEELHDEKLNYEEDGNIKTLPYNNYKKFVMYNIKDVILLDKLEELNDDIGMLFSLADATKTRINKVMRKTISIKNMAYWFYQDQGYAMGNNPNMKYNGWGDEEEDDEDIEKFAGAIVADPLLNGYNGIDINGAFSKFVYEFAIDFDYSALYPSNIRAFNIDATTQYGRLTFEGNPPTKEYDMGGDFMDNLECQDPINVGKKWLNLPSTSDLINLFKEEGLIN